MLNRHFLIYSNFPYTHGKAACYHNTVIRKFTNTGGILIYEHQLARLDSGSRFGEHAKGNEYG
jgi:hypothetical protein